jgi:polygalacturonase
MLKYISVYLISFCWGLTAISQVYNIVDYGARADDKTDNTEAIQKAVDACTLTGGRVYIPQGIFLTGTIFLKSNVCLYLSENSVLKGIPDLSKYPRMKPQTYRSHVDDYPDIALLYAEKQENISIAGKGTFYGNGDHKVFQDSIDNSKNRPFGIKFVECRDVEVSDIHLRNSAFWMQLYLACDRVRLTNLTIYNQCNMNNDGIDIDGCNDVLISNCFIDASDDAICLKSNGPRLTQNVAISNCVLSTHCYAFKCGTETTGGFKNITVSNIIVRPCESRILPVNGIKDIPGFGQDEGQSAIALQMMDGGIMENINISDFVIDSIETPIFIKLGNRGRKHRFDAPNPGPGSIKNIRIGNITAKNAGIIANSITGYPGQYVENVHLYNIDIQAKGIGTTSDTSLNVPENSMNYPKHAMFDVNLPAHGFYVRHVKNISFSNVQVRIGGNDARPGFVFDDVRDAHFSSIKARATLINPLIRLKATHNVVFNPLMPLPERSLIQLTDKTSSNIFIGQKLIKN